MITPTTDDDDDDDEGKEGSPLLTAGGVMGRRIDMFGEERGDNVINQKKEEEEKDNLKQFMRHTV